MAELRTYPYIRKNIVKYEKNIVNVPEVFGRLIVAVSGIVDCLKNNGSLRSEHLNVIWPLVYDHPPNKKRREYIRTFIVRRRSFLLHFIIGNGIKSKTWENFKFQRFKEVGRAARWALMDFDEQRAKEHDKRDKGENEIGITKRSEEDKIIDKPEANKNNEMDGIKQNINDNETDRTEQRREEDKAEGSSRNSGPEEKYDTEDNDKGKQISGTEQTEEHEETDQNDGDNGTNEVKQSKGKDGTDETKRSKEQIETIKTEQDEGQIETVTTEQDEEQIEIDKSQQDEEQIEMVKTEPDEEQIEMVKREPDEEQIEMVKTKPDEEQIEIVKSEQEGEQIEVVKSEQEGEQIEKVKTEPDEKQIETVKTEQNEGQIETDRRNVDEKRKLQRYREKNETDQTRMNEEACEPNCEDGIKPKRKRRGSLQFLGEGQDDSYVYRTRASVKRKRVPRQK